MKMSKKNPAAKDKKMPATMEKPKAKPKSKRPMLKKTGK